MASRRKTGLRASAPVTAQWGGSRPALDAGARVRYWRWQDDGAGGDGCQSPEI